ncbi:MAG: hypothetical protein ABI992_08810, partial [Chthoniobacterales bacterium]
AFKQSAIAIRANHPWQVMTHRAERPHEQKYILSRPPRLRGREKRDEQRGGGNEKEQIGPAPENP